MATDPFLTTKSVLGLAERVRLAPPPVIDFSNTFIDTTANPNNWFSGSKQLLSTQVPDELIPLIQKNFGGYGPLGTVFFNVNDSNSNRIKFSIFGQIYSSATWFSIFGVCANISRTVTSASFLTDWTIGFGHLLYVINTKTLSVKYFTMYPPQ